MPRQETVVAIRQLSNSGSGEDDRIEFIRYVGRWQPKIHEVWTFGEDGITPEVHAFARIDVSTFVGYSITTDYLTENGSRVPMFGRKLINGKF